MAPSLHMLRGEQREPANPSTGLILPEALVDVVVLCQARRMT